MSLFVLPVRELKPCTGSPSPFCFLPLLMAGSLLVVLAVVHFDTLWLRNIISCRAVKAYNKRGREMKTGAACRFVSRQTMAG